MIRKIKRFLATTFKLYDVPEKKIQETIEFVSQMDFGHISEKLVNEMLEKFVEKV